MNWVPKVAAGWHLCLVVAERLLDGDPIEPISGADAMRYSGGSASTSVRPESLGIEGARFPTPAAGG